MEVISYMFLSATVTAREVLLSLMPLQALQGVIRMNSSYSAFMFSEAVSLYLRSIFLIRPSNPTSYTPSPLWPL